MPRKKCLLSLPRLHDQGGKLHAQWYIAYAFRDPRTDEWKRFREYSGFSSLKTKQARYEYAERRIAELKQKMLDGWTPFDTPDGALAAPERTYMDELINQRYAERWGREKTSQPNIRMFLSEFLESKKAVIIQHSYQTYRSKLRIFAEWMESKNMGSMHVALITQSHICEFLQYMSECNNSSKRTIQKYEQILHNFFAFLVDVKQIISVNPVHHIPHFGRLADEAARPIPPEVREVLSAYMSENEPQLWLFCQMEYYCAIRPNELRQLRIKDIDLTRREIRIPCTISKNRLTERVAIPLQLLKTLYLMQLNRYDPSMFLFTRECHPGPVMVGKNYFRFCFDRVRLKLGLSPEYKLYSFKHTGGVELVNAGVDTWALQRHFRHKSIDTTEKYIRRNFAPKSELIQNNFPDITKTKEDPYRPSVYSKKP